MLQDIRDNSQGVIAKVIIGLIVAVFALFGVESIIGGFVTAPPVAEVNGEEITDIELQQSSQNLLTSFGGNIDGIDQGLVEQLALNQLIEELVLRQAANRANLGVSSDTIDRAIVNTPQFQINGRFDPDLTRRTLAAQGFTVAAYRADLYQRMVIGQMANAFSGSNFVTDAELEQLARLTRQSRDFRYVSVPMGTRTLDRAITDAEIQEYYEANQEQFREDESVIVRYVVLDQANIAEEITVPESELLALYEEERASFEGASEKRAAHILFEVGPSMSEAQALEAASSAYERIQAGEDFAALAAELSSDTGSAQQGGDIGYTDGSAFPDAIEEALEVLTLNEVSEPVVSEFGVHLVKLTEDAQNVFPSFEESRARLEREAKAAEVGLAYSERLETLSNLAFETGDLTTISEQLGLAVVTSDALTRAGSIGIFANPAVINAAFSDSVLLDGNNSDVIEISDTTAVVLRVEQFNESTILPLEEVEPEIAVILRRQYEREAVQEIGEQLLAAATSGEGLDELLAANSLSWIEQTGVERNSAAANREIIQEVFSLPEPAPGASELSGVTLANGTFVLLELNAVTQGSLASLSEEERANMRASMADDFGRNDFNAYLGTLRANADIQTNLVSADGF
jgi:peptidyl-prolyl cis-trans isomerase D